MIGMITLETLTDIWYEIEARDGKPGSDGITVDAFKSNSRKNLSDLRAEIISGNYCSSPARIIKFRNRDGSVRRISILCVRDRIAHKAAKELAGLYLERRMSEVCHSYRREHGVRSATEAVRLHVQSGYKWSANCDIEKFFDTINVNLLLSLTDSWLPADVACFVRGCIEPLAEDGLGVPQGSALSPLLSNIYLDTFDAEAKEIAPIVRYSDNFVLMAHSSEEAKKLIHVAAGLLADFGLRLNSKSVVSPASGMAFLGETI